MPDAGSRITDVAATNAAKPPSTSTEVDSVKHNEADKGYLVEAILIVELPTQPPSDSEADPPEPDAPQELEILTRLDVRRNTIATLLKSQKILKTTLVHPEIAGLPLVLENRIDTLTWLHDRLEVHLAENSETVALRFRCSRSEVEAGIRIVNQVLHTYVIEVEQSRELQARTEMERTARSHRETAQKLLRKLEDFSILSDSLGEEHPKVELLKLEIDSLKDLHQVLSKEIRENQIRNETMRDSISVFQEAAARKL